MTRKMSDFVTELKDFAQAQDFILAGVWGALDHAPTFTLADGSRLRPLTAQTLLRRSPPEDGDLFEIVCYPHVCNESVARYEPEPVWRPTEVMTNRELLAMPRSVLGEIDKQRLFLLRVEGTPMPCPACQKPVNIFDAAGIDIDQYDCGHTQYSYRCPSCGAELEQVVPALALGPLWHWQLKEEWLRQQLAKAADAATQPSKDGNTA